ncbi:MAG: tetratricopeptide repeat protein [Planctomycetes bacterium]|nr:tetratricopeptide repeat protein [Planctomycetota bacterium]
MNAHAADEPAFEIIIPLPGPAAPARLRRRRWWRNALHVAWILALIAIAGVLIGLRVGRPSPPDLPRTAAPPPAQMAAAPPIEDEHLNLEEIQVVALLEDATASEKTRPSEAVACYEKILQLCPSRTDLWKKIGDGYLACEDRSSAIRAYREFLKHHPERVEALNNVGILEFHAGRLNEAQECLETAVAAAPSANAHYNLGNIHLKRGDLEKAAASYRRALELAPGHEQARFNLALTLERQGRPAEAASILGVFDSDSAEVTRLRVRLAAATGGTKAQHAFELARACTDVAVVTAGADGFRRAGDLEKAQALLDHAVELAPRDAAVLCNRGVVRQALGRLSEAAADYEAATRLDPSFADAHFNLGVLEEERGRWVEALEHYAEATRAQSASAPAYNNIGVLYLKVGQPAKAAQCFTRACGGDPSFAPARLNLAWAYLDLQDKDRAVEELKRYAALVPLEARDPEATKALSALGAERRDDSEGSREP